MVEMWPQIICNRCGETELSNEPNLTRAEFRKRMARYGWAVNRGWFKHQDYCSNCVSTGEDAVGEDVLSDEQPAVANALAKCKCGHFAATHSSHGCNGRAGRRCDCLGFIEQPAESEGEKCG